MTQHASMADRLAIWRSRKAAPASQLWPLPPLPLAGASERAEGLLAADILPEGDRFDWLNDLAALGDERAGRFAAKRVAEWTGQRPSGWTAEATGWRLLHWLSHARFLYPRGVPAEALASLSRQAEFLHQRWQAPAGWGRIAALAGLSAAAFALERPALRPQALALPPLPPLPEDLLQALVLLLSLHATWPEAVPTDAIADAACALRAMRHADGHLTRLRGGAGGDPSQLDAALVLSNIRRAPPAQAMGMARLAHGRCTVIADLSRPALGFELTSGRIPIVIAAPDCLAEPEVAGHPPRPARVTDIAVTANNLSARHTGWQKCRLIHSRSLTLSSDGRMLTGCDLFDTRRRMRAPLQIILHFPLHPDIRVTDDGPLFRLTLPNGEGWTFACPHTTITPHGHHIAASMTIDRFPARFDWTFAKSGATPLTIRDLPTGA